MLVPLLLLIPRAGASAEPKVVNGGLEEGYPSVVALGAELGDQVYSMCTGNVITPRIVLTAGHCGDDLPLELVVTLGRAWFGESIDDPDAVVRFDDMIIHPDYVPLGVGPGADLAVNDVAVMVLTQEAPAAPMWFRRDAVARDQLGTEMVSVGFGVTGIAAEGSGTRRSAPVVISQLREQFLVSFSADNPDGGQICSGDSGGPQVVFDGARDVQWAIHSWSDSACELRSGSTRTDLVAEWILDQVEAVHGTRDVCEANGWYGDGACDDVCEARDPDCDAVEDVAGCGCSGAGRPGAALPWAVGHPWAVGLPGAAALAFRRKRAASPLDSPVPSCKIGRGR